MGNEASKVGENGQAIIEQKIQQDESLVNKSKDESYENDSFTCQGSKSTIGTDFTRTDERKENVSVKSERQVMNDTGSSNRLSKHGRADMNRQSSHITDDQVHVNLAMADLMAYLQVVANNSNNLPLTRRDDPELGRTVSNLTPDEYARKSAAFIPSDVRVIGGSFTRYGRVWDLPTSEEFNACDGAQEPGKSERGSVSKCVEGPEFDINVISINHLVPRSIIRRGVL